MTTVRAFLAIAASKNCELHQMDVHNAFLHGDLDKEVYVKLPPGFESSDPSLDLGPLKYFLGIEVARSCAGIFPCQRKYNLDIISEAGLLGAKPSGFPIEQNHKLGLATVHILSQFMHEPRSEHWEAALRVVRYLKRTPGQGILLSADNDLTLQGWCDSDWAACPLTHRSLSGWLVFLGHSPIS
ncbi:uncharacterized protein LOC110687200 [Chenopodium quinoa]|uniref:uncharacterized protein LOC110687200 n=1 Tax=Chenopodium quinoa TaxID=63459 RepID=UPI000B7991E7|nr:uncharacterized protein LOC110687200 [Chenopodium quinoa]